MARRAALLASDLCQGLIETVAVNDRINQLILENLAPQAWTAKPPGRNARTIAAIFVHMHNVRRKWIRLSAPHMRLPAQLDRTHCTQRQAQAALAESAKLCATMVGEALVGREDRVRHFVRDGWGRPWPAGAVMVVYMISHEAHHRGQVCMLAHQLGFPLPIKSRSDMWVWEKLWRQCGFAAPR